MQHANRESACLATLHVSIRILRKLDLPLLMASQPASSVNLTVSEFHSFIRGYRAYKDIWTPAVGEVLVLKHEPDNVKEKSAVAVHKEGDVVGHVPYNISSLLSNFLKRDCNKGFVEVTGSHVNHGAGYGLEVPCIYRLYGPQPYTEKFKKLYDH